MSQPHDTCSAPRLCAADIYRHHRGVTVLSRDETAGSFENVPGVISESTFSDLSAEALAAPRHMGIAEFHAKECCARFNNHVICGRTVTHLRGTADDGTAIPGCSLGEDCIWPLPKIRVADFNVAILAAVSCGSLRTTNRLFRADSGLGLNLFHAAPRAFLSSYRFVISNAFLSSLLADWMLAGLPLGRIANEVNAFLESTHTDEGSFVLLGDPDDCVDIEQALDVVDSSPAVEAGHRGPALSSRPCDVPLVASWGPSPSVQALVARGIVPAALAGESNTNVTGVELVRRIAHRDNRQGLWLPLMYLSEHRVDPNAVDCVWCGERCTVYLRKGRTEAAWERTIVNCPLCGLIADVPRGHYRSITLEAPHQVRAGEPLNVRSTHIAATEMTSGACALSLIHCHDFFWPEFERHRTHLSTAGADVVADFAATVPGRCYPFAYWLRATWLTTKGLHWISKPLVIAAQT